MYVFQDVHWIVHIVWNVTQVIEIYERFGYVENWQVRVVCMPDKPVHEVLDVRGDDYGRADFGVCRELRDVVTCIRCMGLPCS